LTNGDDAFVGRYLGLAALGLYQMAYKISNLPATEITHVISQVALPLYSKFQNDTNELQKLFLKTFEILVLIVFPFSIMIFVYAEDFTKIFFGDKWLEMAPAIQILVIFGLTRSLGASMGPLLYSKGIPRVQAKLSFYQLLMMIVLIYPLSKKWGILGASLAIVIPNLLIFVIITITIKRLIQLRYVDFLKNTFISLTSSAILIFILFIGNFIHFNNIAFKIIILAGISILCYSVSVFILIQKRTQKSKINYV
jgi:O-antigen/teichoic acid export membrane protein